MISREPQISPAQLGNLSPTDVTHSRARELASSEWFKEARERYMRNEALLVESKVHNDRIYTDTGFVRAVPTVEWVKDNKDRLQAQSTEVLIVGPGFASGSSAVPYAIAAAFDQYGLDYQMGIVDVLPEVLHRLLKDEFIIAHPTDDYWPDYLSRTGTNTGRVIDHDPAYQQLFRSTKVRSALGDYPRVILRELQYADIPSSFRRKRDNNELDLQHADIVLAELDPERYDLADVLNVLYQLPGDGARKLALINIVRALKRGGSIHLMKTDLAEVGEAFIDQVGLTVTHRFDSSLAFVRLEKVR